MRLGRGGGPLGPWPSLALTVARHVRSGELDRVWSDGFLRSLTVWLEAHGGVICNADLTLMGSETVLK